MSRRPVLIVGLAPRRPGEPRPLDGASGDRLARIAGLPSRQALFELADVVNFCPRPADRLPSGPAAQRRVSSLVRRAAGRTVILLGREVSRAFGLERHFSWQLVLAHTRRPARGWIAVVASVPHPSGRCRWYNDPANRAAAREFLSTSIHVARAAAASP